MSRHLYDFAAKYGLQEMLLAFGIILEEERAAPLILAELRSIDSQVQSMWPRRKGMSSRLSLQYKNSKRDLL